MEFNYKDSLLFLIFIITYYIGAKLNMKAFNSIAKEIVKTKSHIYKNEILYPKKSLSLLVVFWLLSWCAKMGSFACIVFLVYFSITNK